MLDRTRGVGRDAVERLAAAIAATGTASHLDRLTDLVGALVPHDVVTITRYGVAARPVFLSHRGYSDAMVRRYLDVYHAYDPFDAYWRRERRPGVVPLRSLADGEAKRGRYVAEFLRQSVICDEVGVLLGDGEGCCLGIFLDRARRPFAAAETDALRAAFPALSALHARHVRDRGPDRAPGPALPPPGAGPPALPPGLWPELSGRERELVRLILAGHPSAAIAQRLGIAPGTVKNHRRRIYAKLDITTERELFLQYFGAAREAAPPRV